MMIINIPLFSMNRICLFCSLSVESDWLFNKTSRTTFYNDSYKRSSSFKIRAVSIFFVYAQCIQIQLKMLWLILFVVSAIFLYIKIWKPHQYWNDRNVPVLKADYPILGCMARIFFRRTSFAEGLIELCNRSNSR